MKSFTLTITLASFALLACARVQMPRPTEADGARASGRWPGSSRASLERGRSLYVARCSVCHQPVEPTSIPAAEWPTHISDMKQRAGLSEEEARLIEQYLVTMASPPPLQAQR